MLETAWGEQGVRASYSGIDKWPFVRYVLDKIELHRLKKPIQEAVLSLANGEVVLLPGNGTYALFLDGWSQQATDRLRTYKGRREDQREATVLRPSKKLFDLVDFYALGFYLNQQVTPELIKRLYRVGPAGLILPCIEDVTPEGVIMYRERQGLQIPTIMNIWMSNFPIYERILWDEAVKYPNVLLAGTSANRTGENPSVYFEEALTRFRVLVEKAVRDPFEDKYTYHGSHTIFDLTQDPPVVARMGSITPDTNPRIFNQFKKILPNLKLS